LKETEALKEDIIFSLDTSGDASGSRTLEIIAS
jgi:hypothetical protein